MLTDEERRHLLRLEQLSPAQLSPAERVILDALRRRSGGSQQQSSPGLMGNRSRDWPDGGQQQQQQQTPFSSPDDHGVSAIVARDGNVPD